MKKPTQTYTKLLLKLNREGNSKPLEFDEFILFHECNSMNELQVSCLTRDDIFNLIDESTLIKTVDIGDDFNVDVNVSKDYKLIYHINYSLLNTESSALTFELVVSKEFSSDAKGKPKYRQHFLPRFLLKEFTIRCNASSNNFWLYDKINKSSELKVGINHYYFWERPFLYTFGEKTKFLEDTLFHLHENSLVNIKAIPSNITHHDKKRIAYLYKTVLARNPINISAINKSTTMYLYNNLMKFKRYGSLESLRAKKSNVLKELVGNLVSIGNKDIDHLIEYLNMLEGSWTIIKIQTEIGILANDQLVTKVIVNGEYYILLHISFHDLILIDLNNFDINIKTKHIHDENFVKELNQVVFDNSNRFVFYDSNANKVKKLKEYLGSRVQ